MSGEELGFVLKDLGWQQKELADRLGVTPDTVSSWRRGRTRVPQYVVEYLRVMRLIKYDFLEGMWQKRN